MTNTIIINGLMRCNVYIYYIVCIINFHSFISKRKVHNIVYIFSIAIRFIYNQNASRAYSKYAFD